MKYTAFEVHNRTNTFMACILAYSHNEAVTIAYSYTRANSVLYSKRVK